jgi:alkaline phosphatase D
MPQKLSRRAFVHRSAAAAALAAMPFGRVAAQVRFSSYPFKLGVASGDPSPDGFVLWTRLAPEPLEPGELGRVTFEVDWEVADDPGFGRIAARGRAFAPAHLAHSVHVEVGGLQPGQEYFYRFRLGRYDSPIGRALTAPASTESLRFAFSSCAHYEHGFFSAYRYMADDRPDLMIALGDYIYEDGYGERRVRLFDTREARTLAEYRNRYAQYRTDPDLQAAHEACPWLLTWDDHEVDNDYAGFTSEHELCGGEAERIAFRKRRAAAYQAWFEHMPVRPSRLRAGGGIRLYDTLDWGKLARFCLLDTRQYRSPQACPREPTPAHCDPARWNLLAQSVAVAAIREGAPERPLVHSDSWPAYPAARERLLQSLSRHRVSNPVVLTGDVHAFFLSEVRDADQRPVAVELVTSSIATNNKDWTKVLPLNPHIRFHDGTHSGYVRCTLDRDRLQADFVGIDDIRDPRTPRAVLASFEVAAGSGEPRRIG